MQTAVNRLQQQKMAAAPAGNSGSLIAFLPARGGCGTTTLAVNAAGALQKLRGSVLLADFDFHNSVVAFWLKLDPKHGLQEALERAHWLDPGLWKSMVHPLRGLDVLTAPQALSPIMISGPETNAVLDFTLQTYDFVFVDLPEAIYSSCWEVLNRAKYIMLVATPEVAGLYLARRKLAQLIDHGIPKDKIRLLLNRSSHLEPQASEVEKFLSLPVMAAFGNQYKAVTSAFVDGTFIPEGSKLGMQFTRFAEMLAGLPAGAAKEKKFAVQRLRQIFSPA